MPYIKASHREALDPFLSRVATELVESSTLLERPEQIGQLFLSTFLEIARSVKELELAMPVASSSSSFSPKGSALADLGKAVVEAGKEDGGFWAGDLNYSLTRIIQIVPRELVARKKWDREFRYWTYAVVAGALERAAIEISGLGKSSSSNGAWIDTALVGVLLDVKDEYKRRVNAPYEERQIQANGDCYDVKF